MYFVLGIPAEWVTKLLQQRFPDAKAPSEKTVRRHYALIGEAIYKRFAEPTLFVMDPRLSELKQQNPEDWKQEVEDLFVRVHENLVSTEKGRALFKPGKERLPVAVEVYRVFSSNKSGTRQSSKAHLCLAVLYDGVQRSITSKKGAPASGWETAAAIYGFLKREFKEEPC